MAQLAMGVSQGLAAPAPEPACGAGRRFHCGVWVQREHGLVVADATPTGFGPADLQSAYAIDASRGAGVTIGIVDAYGYANLESDLAAYRAQYGLPACTVKNGCLRIVNDQGDPSPLPAPGPAAADWEIETMLDVDMVSAACPRCSIVVVQATDEDDLEPAQLAALKLGVTVISNSWGGPEDPALAQEEASFDHPGVAVFSGTGDNAYDDGGAGPFYPSTSTHVVAVGGTSLARSSSARGWSESTWSDGGSSCSGAMRTPFDQPRSAACALRIAADVSAVGDPGTGLAVYDSGNGGFVIVGGTSAATPIVAAIMAMTGHGDVTPEWFYGHASAFHDVTRGTNGACGNILCDAGTGWDGPTGVGTPNASDLAALPPTGGPAVSLGEHAASVTVDTTFAVDATVGAEAANVELVVDGDVIAALAAAPYHFTLPTALAGGLHLVEVTAYDASGDAATTSVSVNVVPGTGSATIGNAGPDVDEGVGCSTGGGGNAPFAITLAFVVGGVATRRRR